MHTTNIERVWYTICAVCLWYQIEFIITVKTHFKLG